MRRHLTRTIRLIVAAIFLSIPGLFAQGFIDVHSDGPIRRPIWSRPGPAGQPIRLDKHDVQVVIDGSVAKTTVTQVFSNPNGVVLEGTYVFPISDQASLTEFTMVMNQKVVKGEIVEKEKARAIYENIVRQARDPALLEYVGQKLFQARVFPINPNSTVEISLTYVEQLAAESGIVEYKYPLKSQAFAAVPVDRVSVHATITQPGEIKSVFSSSHAIDKAVKSDHKVDVSFEGRQMEATKDFHLFYTLGDGAFGVHLMSDMSVTDGGTFMLTLAPRQETAKENIRPKDVVFVIDTSGSMREDQKMEQAIGALKYGLKSLQKGDRFNIVAFATEARPFADRLMDADEATIGEALKWTAALSANGGTAIYDALLAGLKSLTGDSDRLGMVVFLTDGAPTVGEQRPPEILKAVKAANAKKVRLFVYGVGYDVNATLLDALAEENRGARDYVTPSQNIEVVLGRFFDRITYPVLSDISIAIDGVKTEDVFPKVLPDLFKGGEITLCGKYAGAGTHAIRLKGKIGAVEKEFIYEATFADKKTDRDFILPLWARRKIGWLCDQIRISGESKELVDEVVRLSKKFGVATPYTSFLVTEGDGVAADRPVRRLGAGNPPAPRRGGMAPTGGGAAPGASAGVPPATKAAPAFDYGDDKDGVEAKKELAEELHDEFSTVTDASSTRHSIGAGGESKAKNAVEESRESLKLRDSRAGEDLPEERAMRTARVGERSFERRGGVWVEDAFTKTPAAEIEKKAEVIESFSPAYFDLLKADPDLAKVVAKFASVVIKLKDRMIWVRPAATESRPASAPTKD